MPISNLFEENSRQDKILKLPHDEALNLIYMWVKSDIITRREFRELLQFIN